MPQIRHEDRANFSTAFEHSGKNAAE